MEQGGRGSLRGHVLVRLQFDHLNDLVLVVNKSYSKTMLLRDSGY